MAMRCPCVPVLVGSAPDYHPVLRHHTCSTLCGGGIEHGTHCRFGVSCPPHFRPSPRRKIKLRAGALAVKSTDLRPGMAVKLDGNLFVITQFTHVTPGNLRAFVSIKIKNVINGALIERRLRSGEDIDVVDLDRRPMEYLFTESSGHVFMDQDNYEQISLP